MKNKSSVLYLFLLISALILLYGCHSLSPITQIPTAVTTSSSSTAATIKEKPVTLPSNISNYSKAALLNNITPFIQTGIKSIQNNTPLSKQVLIPKLTANVIQCDYFAYQDYENGKISKKQLLQIIINTQKSITSLTSEFFQVNSIVINYPLKPSKIGLSYFETFSSQTNWNTQNCVLLQEKLMNLATAIYVNHDISKMESQFKLYGVYLAQSNILGYNNDADISNITLSNFKESWLISNGYYSKSFINALAK